MDIEQIKHKVKKNLSEKRYLHTLRVTELARQLARTYGASEIHVQKAALIHDYLKETPNHELQSIIESTDDPLDILAYHPVLWHGPAAAIIAEKEFDIHEPSIIEAVRYHTTGRAQMDLIEEIVFIADYMEPARSFPGIEEVREAATKSIEQAISLALGNSIRYLIHQKATIHPQTFQAYNAYVSTSISEYGGNKIW